ncbi:MAG: hypothetical protein IPJ41_09645 [Phycisphaerales bacterium]|nr:hypothetical protein [Phycisphaerales bacterium]
MLLADDSRMPVVKVAWTKADGSPVSLEARLPYASPEERVPLGENLEVFAGLGGARLEKGAGHSEGAIVRVGLYKADPDRLFFTDIANESSITIDLTNVAFNQTAWPEFDTLIQRLQYKADDVQACGLTVDQTEMYNIASGDDTMGGTILPSQVRFACLDGSNPEEARAKLSLAEDGTLSLHVVIPYAMLRHKGDPWSLVVPGTFFEPFHFDFEYEVLPQAIAEAEGVAPPERLPAAQP